MLTTTITKLLLLSRICTVWDGNIWNVTIPVFLYHINRNNTTSLKCWSITADYFNLQCSLVYNGCTIFVALLSSLLSLHSFKLFLSLNACTVHYVFGIYCGHM